MATTSPDKEAQAKEFGGHHFQKWGTAEEMKAVARSFDLVLSTISAEADWDAAFSLLANNGVLCFVGIPVPSLNVPLIPLIFGQKSVVGSIVGGRRFMQEMLEFAAVNRIKPTIETMPLSKVNEAMDKVAANKARYRIVLLSE